MIYGKIVNSKLEILGPRVFVGGQWIGGDSDEAADYRAQNGFVPVVDTPPTCEAGYCACICGCHYDSVSTPTKIVIDYTIKTIAEADAQSLAASIDDTAIEQMTQAQKTIVIKKLSTIIHKAMAFLLVASIPFLSFATFIRVPAGELRDSDLVVVDTPEWTKAATNNAESAVYEVADNVRGVVETTWYRSDDWAARFELLTEPTVSVFESIVTNLCGCVSSNIVTDTSYGMAARLYVSTLDRYSMTPPPQVNWRAMDIDNTSIVSNAYIVASAAGMFKAAAVSQVDSNDVKTVSIPLSRRIGKEEKISYYVADAAIDDSWIKGVNDEWLEDVQDLANDGHIYHRTYGDRISYDYKHWQFPTGMNCYFRSGAHRFARILISPRVIAVAAHYGGLLGQWVTTSFYDSDGVAHPITTGGLLGSDAYCWNLGEWAKTHGWSEQEVEAMGIGDIGVYISRNGNACDSSSCPWFISRETFDRHFGASGAAIGGWGSTQAYSFTSADKRRDAYPVMIECKADRNFCWANPNVMDGDRLWRSKIAGDGQAAMRKDLKDYFESFGSNAEYWYLPPIYEGDSGTPLFIKRDGKMILLSHYTYITSGPSYVNALPVLRKFCDEQVRETLGVSVGDTIKEVTE